MVKAAAVRQYIAFNKEQDVGLVCVFVGATSGIGANTLKTMVHKLQKSTFYVLGRSASRFANQCAKLNSLNPSCKIVFIQAEVSLLSAVDAACKQITASEQKLDYLYMSPGLIPLNGPQCTCFPESGLAVADTVVLDTNEGLETCFVVSYYARIRLVCNLLPLLRQSPRPRVLSVLNGGKEKAIHEQDIGLDKKWSPISVVNHTTLMMTLSFEHLAEENRRIAFLHTYPGLVKTDIFARLTPPESSGLLWRVTLASIRGLVAVVMLFVGMEVEECGERQAFHLTTDRYGPGMWRINSSSEPVSAPGVLEQYRAGSWSKRIWEYTMSIFDTTLAVGSDSVPK
ncbi:hypothetical protein BDR22DRAFT_929586 [Usnea florida]